MDCKSLKLLAVGSVVQSFAALKNYAMAACRCLGQRGSTSQGIQQQMQACMKALYLAARLYRYCSLCLTALYGFYCKTITVCYLHQDTVYLQQVFTLQCRAVQGTPPAYKKKASRLVGGKCTLLARIDAYGQDPTGSAGANMKVKIHSAHSVLQLQIRYTEHFWRSWEEFCMPIHPARHAGREVCKMQEEMSKKIEKWQEKGPAKQGRVLPVPDMEPKKRRGGKRARKYKERYGLTDTKKVLLQSITNSLFAQLTFLS